ncbi:hypothetical protein NWE61_06470 [Mycoplasmopsis felis]|uniref:hypothetical protein n=1 Tax=Mycoplasmopsis felis TaxID=33923 RepID=UPI0021E0FC6F|nr:hypothetical protein [Mycoplasmopsis felis]MCU9934697.1 hypothetical protein [Mycoplasmopsis felis]
MKNGVKVINLSYYLSNESEYNCSLNILIRYHKILKMRLHFLLLLEFRRQKYSDVYKKGLLGDGLSYNSIVVGAIRNNDFWKNLVHEEVKQVKKLML